MTDLIGFVLIFSLIAVVVAVVSVAGMSSLQSARDAEQIDNAERAMDVLADNMADLYERGAPSRATEISLSQASMYMGDPVTIRAWDHVGSSSFDETFTVRPIVYRGSQNVELVYVMGAIFRVQRDSGVVLRRWSPILQDDRAVLPVLNTTSQTGDSQAIKSSTVLVRANTRERTVAVAQEDFDQQWKISVDSPRRDLWKRMLGSEDGVDCSTPSPPSTVVECTVDSDNDAVYVVHTRVTVALKR